MNSVRAIFKVLFFFQAEDGIRYTSVTGVQTCALPIYIRNLSFADLDWSHQNQIKTDIKGIPEISDSIVLDDNEFLNNVCVTFGQKNEPAFSIGNIIFLMANFNGGIHYDETPTFSNLEAFHLAAVNPLIPNKHNVFIQKIEEISKVIIHALRPLVFEVTRNLHNYVKSNKQSRAESTIKVIRSDDSK